MPVIKHSKQRDSILNYLCGREDHPTADMIYTSLRQEYPNISLGTVYRNLSLLVELGEIRKITAEGADRYDARITPHSHFTCRKCGSVLDVMVPMGDPVAAVNAAWNGGDVEAYNIEFYGICSLCKKPEN